LLSSAQSGVCALEAFGVTFEIGVVAVFPGVSLPAGRGVVGSNDLVGDGHVSLVGVGGTIKSSSDKQARTSSMYFFRLL